MAQSTPIPDDRDPVLIIRKWLRQRISERKHPAEMEGLEISLSYVGGLGVASEQRNDETSNHAQRGEEVALILGCPAAVMLLTASIQDRASRLRMAANSARDSYTDGPMRAAVLRLASAYDRAAALLDAELADFGGVR